MHSDARDRLGEMRNPDISESVAASVWTRREPLILLALLVFGVATRLVMLAEFQRSNPEATVPGGDAGVYWAMAERIAQGRLVDDKPFLAVPLYPYLLGVVRAVGGGLRAVYLLQVFLHIATGFLIGHLVSRKFDRSIGILAVALFFLLEEPAFLMTRLLPSTLQLFLVVCTLFAADRYVERASATNAGFAGLCIGLLALTYPPAVVLLPFVAIWMVRRTPRARAKEQSPASSVRSRWLAGAVCLGAGAFVIASATIHNWVACGEFIPLTAHAGITLRHGNAPGAEGLYTPVDGISVVREKMHGDMARVYERDVGHSGGFREIDAYFRDAALRYMIGDVSRWTWLTVRKLYWFVTGRHYSDIYYPTLERTDGLAYALLLAPVPTAWLMGLALVGLWPAGTRRRLNLVDWMVLVVPCAIVAVFWYSPRYRLPVIPILIMGAASALVGTIREMRGREGRRREFLVTTAAFAVAVILGFVNAGSGFDNRESYRPQYEYNRGQAFVRLDEYDKALERFMVSDRLDPDRRLVLGAMVDAFVRVGRFPEGEAVCRRLIEVHPSDPLGWLSLGGLSFAMHRLENADAAFTSALAIDALSAEGHLGLWLARSRAGRMEDGIDHLRAAIQYDPRNALAAAEYGLYLAESGQPEEAEAQWRRSLSIAPNQPVVCFNLASLLIDLGRVEDAADLLRHSIRLDPGYDRARKTLRALRTGENRSPTGAR